jgi:phosphatidylinositol kinase/protein kinase (PI-3  family)
MYRFKSEKNNIPIMIFKAGDELGQDHCVMMLGAMFNRRMEADGIDSKAILYQCLPLANRVGSIEVVAGCESLGAIQRAEGMDFVGLGAFKDSTILNWLKKQPNADFEEQKKQFSRTLAGAVLIEYIVGIGDRHSDNVLMRPDGSIFHIDFGMPFGSDWGITKDVPFNLTSQMAAIFGGRKSREWEDFIEKLVKSYMCIRKYHVLVIAALLLAMGAETRELTRMENVKHVYDRLCPAVLDTEAERRFRETIAIALDTKRPQFNDAMHSFYIAHLYKAPPVPK